METKVIGFVFSKTEYKDNMFMLNVLTCQNQSIAFKARGIANMTSKNASACNYFTISEFVFNSKTETSSKTLKNASIIRQYHLPYNDLMISSCFLFMYEIIAQVCEQMEIYNLAYQCFNDLENKKEPIMVLNYFLKQVIIALGYQPNLDGCVYCKKRKELISFSFSSGGFVCQDCFIENVHTRYSANFLKALYRFLTTQEMIELEKDHAICLLDMFATFFQIETGMHVNTYAFLKKTIV